MDDRTIDRIFAGSLDFLPPVSSKIVRIFTSSTFTDTGLERNTLMADVYPKIKEYCREKHGLEFQVVDMRWGVRDEATDDHMTTELCMREIENCQRLSMGPNFVVFLAQKYGYRPIPTYIVSTELQLLRDTVAAMGTDVHLLDLWYKKDSNAVPAVSILQPISSILVNFNNKRVPKLQQQDQATWWETLGKMQKLLRKAASTCLQNETMTKDAVHSYFMSVTEREVINGVLNVKNTKNHCLAYVRYINNINLQNVQRAGLYIDIINRSIDSEASKLLSNLRDERLPNKIESTNLQRYTVEWLGREGLAKETHEEYLQHFLAHFYKNILKLVDRAMRKEDSSAQGQIVTEILQHLHACNNSVKVFYGREEELVRMRTYITGEAEKPLVLHGAGGCGKTSLLARGASLTNDWLSGATPILILRFMGTTPDSSALTPMLISLCQQISYNYMLPLEDIPDDIVPLTAHFKHMLTFATAEQPLVVYLDSVDQVTGAQGANKLTWLPTNLPKHCKIVVSCVSEEDNPEISRDYNLLRRIIDIDENFIEVDSLGSELAMDVMKKWMVSACRDLSNFQWRLVSNALANCSLPIFVKLVFAEVCRWKSYTKPQDTHLASNVTDSIMMLFERIEKQHGKLLVFHALAYITASKSGLSESELEDLISLDDKVLDDVYQYHMPPVRRIPPLLWTRIRNDLPNYLSERDADGVSVLNWYHRQFTEAAMERYFQNMNLAMYFHSSIADYFLGIWGGGTPKPFRYTEIQRHRFGLKDKEGSADRKVPLQPLVFYTKDGKVSRYNLRKFGELPYHLVRSRRFGNLYENVLFNYQWLHAKMASCPLQAVLSDFEDACNNIEDREATSEQVRKKRREIMLVADALRLGGATLSVFPDMLAPQLVGRLLPEAHTNANVLKLLEQCDTEGPNECALLPTYHCLHTPGGPLKYSLEGHQFAVFGFCLTADYRYIVSVSNKFITWDLSTSDLCREVTPGIEGVMHDLVISPDNRFAATYTSNNQAVLVNMLTSDFEIIDNPLEEFETVRGVMLLNTHLFIYGYKSWCVFNMRGVLLEKGTNDQARPILTMNYTTLEDHYTIYWSGVQEDKSMVLINTVGGTAMRSFEYHSALAMSKSKKKIFCCNDPDYTVVEADLGDTGWEVQRTLSVSPYPLLQLELSKEESFLVGTFKTGFQMWELATGREVTLEFPHGVRNISIRLMKSTSCVLSRDNVYAVTGVRKNLYVWDMSNGKLLKELDAHFGRIISIALLTIGNWNSVITSSIDRTVKVWNINNIFEQVHVIDRHEMQIDGISLSTTGLAITVTRNCIGVWDIITGKLTVKLADSPLGAIVTHAVVTQDGKYIVSAESGNIILWNLPEKTVVFKEEHQNVKQIILTGQDKKFLTVSRVGAAAECRCQITCRSVPDGEKLYEFEYIIRNFRSVVLTSDEQFLVLPGYEKLKDTLFIHQSETGMLHHKIILKYPNYKDFHTMVTMPHRPTQIALIDTDKGNILDVRTKKFIRSVQKWGGKCTKDGKYGLYAPARGGLDLLELRHGSTVRTFIPRVAEGVFSVTCMFNQTDEYVMYYHTGRKTLRIFRTQDAVMLANYRVPAELGSINSTADGKAVLLGTMDGCLASLTIADPKKPKMQEYLKSLPSRIMEKEADVHVTFKTAAKVARLAVRHRGSSKDMVEKGGS